MKLLSLERLKNMELVDLINPKIVRFKWIAKDDPKTCDYCRSRDDMIINSTDSEYNLYMPPAHPHCRCHWANITSDNETIPERNWSDPLSSFYKYIPFILLPFIGKKEEPVEIIFNKDSILDIEELNIENTRQKMKDMETEMGNIYYIVFFLGNKGETVLEKEAKQDVELEFTNREEVLIRERATQYIISDGNDLVEKQIEQMFGIRKR